MDVRQEDPFVASVEVVGVQDVEEGAVEEEAVEEGVAEVEAAEEAAAE